MPSSRVSEQQQHDARRAAEERPAPEAPASGAPAPETTPAPAGADSDLAAEVARLEDRYKRALADLDNFRKRSARELERRIGEATDTLIRDWLEVADSVDRALVGAGDSPLAEGLRAVRAQIDATLARAGVHRVGAPGERFDPERHDAVDMRVTDEADDLTVLEVTRAGYVRGNQVLRPAQVVVARRPPASAPDPGEAPAEPTDTAT
jgi:molecular chaperone GrpE